MLIRTPTRKHDRPRRRPDVVKVYAFTRFGTPPRQRAPREQQRTYPTCEDGVDPFTTTASAANDETIADEYDG